MLDPKGWLQQVESIDWLINGAYCVCGIRRSRIAKDLSQAGIPCDAWRVSNIELERRQSRYATWSREDERSEPYYEAGQTGEDQSQYLGVSRGKELRGQR